MTWPPCHNLSRKTSSNSMTRWKSCSTRATHSADDEPTDGTSQGHARQFDLTTIAALASGAYMANQTIANLVHETNFNSVYQQGEKFSMFVMCIDEHCLLSVIFKAHWSVGAVKYFAAPAVQKIAEQLQLAQEREPGGGLDLSVLNLADPSQVFRKKT